MEKQTLEIMVEFEVEHNPGNDLHLASVVGSYLKSKGVKSRYEDKKLIIEV